MKTLGFMFSAVADFRLTLLLPVALPTELDCKDRNTRAIWTTDHKVVVNLEAAVVEFRRMDHRCRGDRYPSN